MLSVQAPRPSVRSLSNLSGSSHRPRVPKLTTPNVTPSPFSRALVPKVCCLANGCSSSKPIALWLPAGGLSAQLEGITPSSLLLLLPALSPGGAGGAHSSPRCPPAEPGSPGLSDDRLRSAALIPGCFSPRGHRGMCSASLDLGPPAEGSTQPPCEQLVQGLSEGAELWQETGRGLAQGLGGRRVGATGRTSGAIGGMTGATSSCREAPAGTWSWGPPLGRTAGRHSMAGQLQVRALTGEGQGA